MVRVAAHWSGSKFSYKRRRKPKGSPWWKHLSPSEPPPVLSLPRWPQGFRLLHRTTYFLHLIFSSINQVKPGLEIEMFQQSGAGVSPGKKQGISGLLQPFGDSTEFIEFCELTEFCTH